jgi:hypothetical protein
MTSLPTSRSEKVDGLANQPTSRSDASSSTFYSRMSFPSLRHVASNLGLLAPQKKPDDVEQQAGCDEVDDDASIFAPGGPDGTKVRKREY